MGCTTEDLQVDCWAAASDASVQTGSGTHPDSYVLGTVGEGAPFLGVKWSGPETDRSPPSNTQFPLYAFMLCAKM
jgi:hypothetical protein